jgi:hypothetical protein
MPRRRRIGLVDILVEDAELHARTLEMARAMAAHSPVALRLAKSAVAAALEAPLAAGLAHERELFITAFGSDDRTEGVTAFLEKRTPEFTGHRPAALQPGGAIMANPFGDEPFAPKRVNPFGDEEESRTAEESVRRIEHAARSVRGSRRSWAPRADSVRHPRADRRAEPCAGLHGQRAA